MSAQPLKDIRVLEFGQFVAAPYAAEVLADLGAEVIKVEHPDGDGIRGWGPHPGGESAPYMAFNRAKRNVAIDFRTPQGQDIVRRLYDRVDVVIENYRPGVTDKYGLGPEAARARNPRLVYCSISGFGQRGDGAGRPAFDLILQGITGMMDMTGEPGRAPAKVPVPIADGTAALHATTAILAALHERERSGEGATIDISLQASTLTWMMLVAAGYFADGRTPARLGSAHPLAAPYQALRTADGYITIAAGNDRQWRKTSEALGLDADRDPRFASSSDRARNQEELRRLVEERLATRPSAAWLQALNEAGVPCGPIHGLAEALDDPSVEARGLVGEFTHPKAGRVRTIGNPIAFEEPNPPPDRSPLLGEHTVEVLAELGYGESDVRRMMQENVVEAPPSERPASADSD